MQNLNAKLFLFCVLVFFSGVVFANDYHVLDQIQATYEPLQSKWQKAILPFAYSLFWKLVLLDVIWSSMKMVMERKELGEVMTWFAQKALTVGFFFTLLKMSSEWLPQIVGSFALIGIKASGITEITPDSILNIGIDVSTSLIGSIGKLGILEQIGLGLFVLVIALFVVLCFVIIAGQLLIAIIESYIVMGGGIIMLGFTGSKWTVEMGTAYLKYAVGAGVKIMVAYLIIGAGIAIFSTLSVDSNNLIKSLLVLFANAAFFAYFATQIPGITAAMVSGSPSSTLGGITSAAAGVAGAMVGGMAGVKSAGTSTAGAAMKAYDTGSRALGFGNNLMNNGIGNGVGKAVDNVPDPTGFSPSSKDGMTASVPNSLYQSKSDMNASKQGDASKATIGNGNPEKSMETMYAEFSQKMNPPKTTSQQLQDKFRSIQSAAPNDQANIQVSGINLSHGKE